MGSSVHVVQVQKDKMGNRRSPTRRLRLHRETVRTLSDRQMTAVAGAGKQMGTGGVLGGDALFGGDPHTDPKSNAWTGDTATGGYCNI